MNVIYDLHLEDILCHFHNIQFATQVNPIQYGRDQKKGEDTRRRGSLKAILGAGYYSGRTLVRVTQGLYFRLQRDSAMIALLFVDSVFLFQKHTLSHAICIYSMAYD